jgi:hypothetical protein
MEQRRRKAPRSAGSILAISVIAGAVAGTIVGQSSIGFLAGAAIGTAALILFWLNDRRRSA